MNPDPLTTASEAQGPRAGKGERPDPQRVFAGLEQLRATLRERLNTIEALAVERAEVQSPDPSEREKALRKRIAELEQRQTLLVSEAKRKEQECQAAMEKIESDRKLLAEAWERLERERIEGAGASAQHPAPHHPAPRPAPVLHAVDTPSFHPPGSSDDVVAQAILKQFHALKSDVRRNAGARRSVR